MVQTILVLLGRSVMHFPFTIAIQIPNPPARIALLAWRAGPTPLYQKGAILEDYFGELGLNSPPFLKQEDHQQAKNKEDFTSHRVSPNIFWRMALVII